MNKKLKNKSYNDGKTKEQIRFFYHRTWSKISKTLNLQPESDTKKACRRELHYLLCLGELRKKRSIGFGVKVMKQLHDLATKGLTYVRQNGRNLRVRPPNRYLRKIYKDITDTPEIVLPKTVNIEFLPNSNVSFNFVQKHAFNPRIRFTGVNINAKFSEVFDMLNKRFTDLYTNEKLELRIYPMQSNKSNREFSKIIAQAIDLLENFERTQDTNIVVEKEETPKDNKDDDEEEEEEDNTGKKNEKKHDELTLEEVLPNIFAEHNDKESPDDGQQSTTKDVKYFPGYWTYEDGKLIYLRMLFVAFEQKPTLKFKYEWKQSCCGKETNSFSSTSLDYLSHLCSSVSQILPQNEINFNIVSPQVHSPQLHSPQLHSPNIVFEPSDQSVVTAISTLQNGIKSSANDNFVIPLRPRPGRRRVTPLQQKFTGTNAQKNTTSPLLHPLNSRLPSTKSLRNAVAVNLIPHPPQLVQYAQLPPEATRLVNSSAGASTGDFLFLFLIH